MNITRGRIQTPKKVIIYGPEGIGKSTFAAGAPDPLFIDTEGSTNQLDVARFDQPSSWSMLKQQVQYVISYPDVCRTLVIDTADWAEKLEIEELCRKKGWDGLEAPGFGKGYTYSAEEFGQLLNLLNDVVAKGVNVIITAHAWLRKVELPEEMGSYDHWEMKTSKKVAPMLREWADAVFFANYKVIVTNIDGQGAQKGKNKASGGRRVMYTTHTPFWDAKNRYSLPDELPFSFDSIAHIFASGGGDTAEPKQAAKTEAPKSAKAQETPAKEPAKKSSKTTKTTPTPEPAPEAKPKEDAPPEVKTEADDIDKRIPKRLRDLMISAGIGEWALQNVVTVRLPGAFPIDMDVKDYPEDFIDEWIIPNWGKVTECAKEMMDKMEIPFK